MNQKYSIIICSFNKLDALKLVAAKVKQLSSESELILSDDHSTDGTIEWAKNSKLFSKIHIEKSPGNYRLNTIRNSGIELASNEYIILLDADCLPEDYFFKGYDDFFKKHPLSVAIGITNRASSDGLQIKEVDKRLSIYNNDKCEKCGWELCFGGNIGFKKILWINNKFDTSYDGYWGFEDLDFSIRLSKQNINFYLCFDVKVRHLEHEICSQSKDFKNGEHRNRDMFEKRYSIRFHDRGEPSIIKKILISKNVKALRNGNQNPKDYPYWDQLIKLLSEHNITFIDRELPLNELKNTILDCDFFISIDSFFQHYAWSVNKKGVVIFSVTDPLIFGHSFHVNVLKDRKYLRKNQFLWMENESYNIDAFESPENIFQIIKLKFL